LRRAAEHAAQVSDLYCPGLGTGIGRIPPQHAAREMADAYRAWLASNP